MILTYNRSKCIPVVAALIDTFYYCGLMFTESHLQTNAESIKTAAQTISHLCGGFELTFDCHITTWFLRGAFAQLQTLPELPLPKASHRRRLVYHHQSSLLSSAPAAE